MPVTTFISPAPVEVETLPWLEELAVKNGTFSRVMPYEQHLDELEGVYVACFDYLREAALEIGKIVLEQGLVAESTLVDVRSGMYDPRVDGDFNLEPHFDVNPSLPRPAPALIVATGKASVAAVGEIDAKEGLGVELKPTVAGRWITRQAQLAGFRGAFDVSRARTVELQPLTLYYLPEFCVHFSPKEIGPYGRNFFRFKDCRPSG